MLLQGSWVDAEWISRAWGFVVVRWQASTKYFVSRHGQWRVSFNERDAATIHLDCSDPWHGFSDCQVAYQVPCMPSARRQGGVSAASGLLACSTASFPRRTVYVSSVLRPIRRAR